MMGENEILENLRASVLKAMKQAEKVPVCAVDELVTDVYAEVPPHLQRQLSELKAHIKKYPHMYPKTAGRV